MATANYSNAVLNIPDGGVYRSTNTDLNSPGAIYFRNGNTISTLDISTFANDLYKKTNAAPAAGSSNDAYNAYSAAANSSSSYQAALDYLKNTYGIDYNSLQQYNAADADAAFRGAGFTYNDYSNKVDQFGNLIKSTQNPTGGNVDFTQNTGGATGTQTVTTPSGAQVTVPNAAVKVPASGSSTMAQYPAQTANQGAVSPGPSASGIPATPATSSTPAATTAPTITPPSTILQPGSADAANVGKLQDYLVSLGLLQPQDLLNGGRGVYGPKTTAAVAALQSALGVDNSTGVGYFGPKTIAALASKSGSLGTGNAAGDSQTANTGTPTTLTTENGLSPAQNIQDVYTKLYADSGLSDIKAHYEDTLKQQEAITNEMNGKIADIKNNPWMSQSEVDRNVKNLQDKYQVKLDTLSHFATLYETIYKDGLDEIQFRTGLAEHDIQRAFEAAQKRQDALDKLAQSDIHSETVNGRVVLVDYKTRKIVADLGASKVATGNEPIPGYNGQFAATISLAAQQGGTNDQRAQMQKNLQEFIANGDYASAYASITDATARGLTGPSKTDFQQRTIQLQTTQDLKNALQALAATGYDTNLLTGTADKIQTKLGVLQTDPRYAAVANQLNLAFQDYRQKMTGAAFGAKESSEYASVLPSASNTLALNLAKIDGLTNYLNSVSDGYIKQIVGQGGVEIKAYANGATPSSSTTGSVGATSGGNSYIITQTP